jgi:hypothetical protein
MKQILSWFTGSRLVSPSQLAFFYYHLSMIFTCCLLICLLQTAAFRFDFYLLLEAGLLFCAALAILMIVKAIAFHRKKASLAVELIETANQFKYFSRIAMILYDNRRFWDRAMLDTMTIKYETMTFDIMMDMEHLDYPEYTSLVGDFWEEHSMKILPGACVYKSLEQFAVLNTKADQPDITNGRECQLFFRRWEVADLFFRQAGTLFTDRLNDKSRADQYEGYYFENLSQAEKEKIERLAGQISIEVEKIPCGRRLIAELAAIMDDEIYTKDKKIRFIRRSSPPSFSILSPLLAAGALLGIILPLSGIYFVLPPFSRVLIFSFGSTGLFFSVVYFAMNIGEIRNVDRVKKKRRKRLDS